MIVSIGDSVIRYQGRKKVETIDEMMGQKGYAAGFEGLICAIPESRSELLLSAFRRHRICEERGIGFRKVVASIELFGLPPVVYTPMENAFKVTLYAPKKFDDMTQDERIEACCQHAVLQ